MSFVEKKYYPAEEGAGQRWLIVQIIPYQAHIRVHTPDAASCDNKRDDELKKKDRKGNPQLTLKDSPRAFFKVSECQEVVNRRIMIRFALLLPIVISSIMVSP